MKLTIKKPVEYEAKYIIVDVPVRYDNEDMPYDAPLRSGDNWRALIDLDTATIVDWPQGKTLSFKDMKICDEGIYTLLDADKNEIARRADYVPNALLPGAYGDYLSLDINEEGVITNWKASARLSDFEESED